MQVRSLAIAAALALTAVGAMSQELDPRVDRSFAHPEATASSTTRAAVVAQTRNLQAQGRLNQVGDLAQAPVTGNDTTITTQAYGDQPKTRAQVKRELAQWQSTHAFKVGDLS